MLRPALVVAFFLAAMLTGSPGAGAKSWSIYAAADKSFSISFPAAPDRSSTPNHYAMNASPEEHISYIAQYDIMTSSVESRPDAAFAAAVQFLGKDGNTLTSMPPVMVAGHPGKDVKVVLKTGVIVWDRIILVDNRLYQLILATDSEKISPVQFWNSFLLAPHP